MAFHLRVEQKKYIFFLLFFSCFSFKSLSLTKTEVLAAFSEKSTNVLTIDQNYFQAQADAFYLKSEMAYYDNQTVQAIDYLKEAILQAPNSLHLRSRLAEIYREEKLFAEEAKQYQFLIEKTDNQKFHYKLAEIYSFRGLNQEALKKNAKNNNLFSASFQQGSLFINEKAWPLSLKSLALAQRYSVTEKEKAEVLLAKAYIYEQVHKKSDQEKVFKQVLNLNITDEDLLLKAAKFYISSKKLKEARSLLLQYQKKNEISIEVTRSLFALNLSLNYSNKAYEQLHRLRELGALDDTHYFFMVSFLLSKNKYVEAIPFIKDLVQEYPVVDYYRYLLGATYEQNKEWKKSLDEYQKIQETSSYFVSAQIQMAQIWKDQGLAKKALHLLEKVVFSSPSIKEPKPLLLYAQYLWEERQKDLSIFVLTKGLIAFPKNTDILFLRGLYFGKSGRTDLALEDMEKILKLNDSHGEAINFVAYTYAEEKKELDRAEALAYKSLSLDPFSSYFLDTLGWVFFQKGDYNKALSYLTKAFLYNKEDSHIIEHLGETYYKLKNFKKCEHLFKQALELETDEQKRLQIKKRLASLPLSI